MDILTGEAATPDASRILRRLCKHWSHKFAVRFDDGSGEIQLNDVRVLLRAAPERLFITLENPQAAVPRRLMGVVAEHLQRMAGDQRLEVTWTDPGAAGAPGGVNP
jgi:hypothetical protein